MHKQAAAATLPNNILFSAVEAIGVIPGWLGEKTPAEVLADLRDGYVDADEARIYFAQVELLDRMLGAKGGR